MIVLISAGKSGCTFLKAHDDLGRSFLFRVTWSRFPIRTDTIAPAWMFRIESLLPAVHYACSYLPETHSQVALS